MNSLFTPIDIYCERLEPGLFAEPLNAISNLFFFLAAYMLARRFQTENLKDTVPKQLALLIALIGAGSLSFHLFANRLTGMLDILFIGIFVLIYVWVLMRRTYHLKEYQASLCIVGFFIMTFGLDILLRMIHWNTLSVYVSSLLLLWGITLDFVRKKHPALKPMLLGTALFTISLAARTADLPLCDTLPIGTHFLWHTLNAGVLYLLVLSIVKISAKNPLPDTKNIENT